MEKERKKIKSPKNRDKDRKSKSPVNDTTKSPTKSVGVLKKDSNKQETKSRNGSAVQSTGGSRINSPSKSKSPSRTKVRFLKLFIIYKLKKYRG